LALILLILLVFIHTDSSHKWIFSSEKKRYAGIIDDDATTTGTLKMKNFVDL